MLTMTKSKTSVDENGQENIAFFRHDTSLENRLTMREALRALRDIGASTNV